VRILTFLFGISLVSGIGLVPVLVLDLMSAAPISPLPKGVILPATSVVPPIGPTRPGGATTAGAVAAPATKTVVATDGDKSDLSDGRPNRRRIRAR
jgi:hypothetical protein